eukprot:TRINITY_DN52822_c0_g1_i1.p1 TRINITY_DN52822_c0_g1~~TRINITY_DN52822_c0_g1_i1.p1  ORF type:complete len:440 (+),score=97.69 TRINITY_DN52822_c0_g1_i1:42-1322(+)
MSSAKESPALTGSQVAEGLCQELLTPSFFEDYFERAPLHHRAAELGRSANCLPEALGVDDVAHIVESAGSSLKMFKNGEPSGLPNPWLAYLDGSSMIVNQADRHHRVLFDLVRGLSARHFHHVFAVMYLTPPESQAVRLHNDDQDVFLLQVFGSKRWTVRNAPQLLCYTEEMLGKESPVPEHLIGPPLMEFTMEPHDVLYIPRGHLHEAATGSSEPSLHITVTVPTSDFCWGVQLVKHLGLEMRSGMLPPPQRSLCQASLAPMGSAGPAALDDEALDKKLEELLESWRSKVSAEAVLDSFEQRMERTNEGQERQFIERCSDGGHVRVTEKTRVRLMPGVSCRCEEGSEDVTFTRATDGRRLDMQVTRAATSLIRALTDRPQRVLDLPCTDRFARICVLQVLLERDVLQLFLKGAEDLNGCPDKPLP